MKAQSLNSFAIEAKWTYGTEKLSLKARGPNPAAPKATPKSALIASIQQLAYIAAVQGWTEDLRAAVEHGIQEASK